MKAAETCGSVEAFTRQADIEAAGFQARQAWDQLIRFVLVVLLNHLLGYEIAKGNTRRGNTDSLLAVQVHRHAAAATCRMLEHDFGLPWERIADTPRYIKTLLGQGFPLPGNDRVWMALAPQNLQWMQELLFEEILRGGLSLVQCILREPVHPFFPAPLSEHQDAFGLARRAEDMARQKLATAGAISH